MTVLSYSVMGLQSKIFKSCKKNSEVKTLPGHPPSLRMPLSGQCENVVWFGVSDLVLSMCYKNVTGCAVSTQIKVESVAVEV